MCIEIKHRIISFRVAKVWSGSVQPSLSHGVLQRVIKPTTTTKLLSKDAFNTVPLNGFFLSVFTFLSVISASIIKPSEMFYSRNKDIVCLCVKALNASSRNVEQEQVKNAYGQLKL